MQFLWPLLARNHQLVRVILVFIALGTPLNQYVEATASADRTSWSRMSTVLRVLSNSANSTSSSPNGSWLHRLVLASALTLGMTFAAQDPESERTTHDFDTTKWAGELCDRECTADEMPRVCYYSWTLEHYASMGSSCDIDCTLNHNQTACHTNQHHSCLHVDGIPRTLMTINRRLPGPPIHVCHRDLIVVDVANHMHGTATAIHWHGFHQRRSPHMDGVPYVTQCPIPFGQSFRYAFAASETGTHFYHAHAGHHKSNGLYGALVVRDVAGRNTRQLYDEDRSDHVVLLSDALHTLAEALVPGLPGKRIRPESLLINGLGRWASSDAQDASASATTTPSPQQLAVFHVSHGRRYRFRIINSASHMCPVRLQVERHRMQVIATDGTEVRPLLVDALYSSGGERYDVVLSADGEPGADYWIRVRVAGACRATQRLEQYALLRYSGGGAMSADGQADEEVEESKRTIPEFEERLEMMGNQILNHPDTESSLPSNGTEFCITHLKSIAATDYELRDAPPDVQLTMAFANRQVDNEKLFEAHRYDHYMNIGSDTNLMGTMNNISFGFPAEPPLLQSRRQQSTASQFCSPQQLPARCRQLPADYPCTCTNVQRIRLGARVEMRIVDDTQEATMSHPFHLHGTSFYVMAIGYNANANRTIPAPERPPLKDTVTVPRNGFVRIRFRANNAGYWLMHCHFEWHLAVGMAALLQIGEPADAGAWPRVPDDFPRCGAYRPSPFR